MRKQDIVIGGTYIARVGARLATVTVQRQRQRHEFGRSRLVFVCVTHDTRREIEASAARLRPVPGTLTAAREAERRAAATSSRAPRSFSGSPGTHTVLAAPVRGMIDRIGAAPVLALSAGNAANLNRCVDGVHVAESFPYLARRVRASIGRHVQWRTIPRELRRGILHAAAVRHAANRRTYCQVMRHEPLPSPRMVADAVGVACGLGPMPR